MKQKRVEIPISAAVSLFCLECMGGDWEEVQKCPCDGKETAYKCFLHGLAKRRPDRYIRRVFDREFNRRDGDCFKVRR